jgi:hypothetical protein
MIQGRTGQAQFDNGPSFFSHIVWGTVRRPGTQKRLCPFRPNFRRKFAPDSIHSDEQDGWAAYGYLNWGD